MQWEVGKWVIQFQSLGVKVIFTIIREIPLNVYIVKYMILY